LLYKTPSGHVQQSPLLGIINKQLELMGRYLIELGMTPAARSRVKVSEDAAPLQGPLTIEFVSGRKLTDYSDEELEELLRHKPADV
ncbi:hypothetical protein CNY89_24125, partial [Amaricoccus sp. HAR-UPW-R2A-40]